MFPLQIMRLLASLGVTLLFFLHAVHVIELPWLARLEHLAYDTRIKMTMPETKDSRIVIVALDEKSLAKVGHWPWGRHHLAQLTNILFDHYRILALGFDVVFAEPDQSSGLPVLEELAGGKLAGNQAFLSELNRLRPNLDRDDRFARSLRGRPVILGHYFKASVDPKLAVSGVTPDPVITLEELGRGNIPFVKAAGLGGNIPHLQRAAQNGGFFDNPLVDADGVNRRIPLLQEYQGKIYQSLPLGLVRIVLGDPPITLGITPSAKTPKEVETGLEWLGLGPHHIPVDERAAILIPFRGRKGSFPYVSASDILDKSADASLLTDAIVLVGATAPGMGDFHSTPVHNIFPGVEMHANIIGGILDGTIKRRSTHAVTIEAFYFLVIAIAFILLMPHLSQAWGFYLSILIVLLIVWSNAIFWRRTDMVIPLVTPLMLTLLLFLLHHAFAHFVVARHKSHLIRLFGQNIPPAQIEEMHQHEITVNVTGERREMTVMMVNIRGFAQVAEEMEPREAVLLLNSYLNRMTALIHDNHGAVDRYMGDIIMAFWGAPLENPRHARHAMQTALLIQQAMNDLKDEFSAQGWPQLKIGIGINTGPMCLGNLGSEFRMAYSVVGESVNMVDRLEILTKQYGVTIIVGEATRKALPEVIFRELDRIRIKGRNQAISLYEPVGFVDAVGGETRKEVDAYHKAVALYRGRRWEEAAQRFQLLQQRDPERMIHDIYLSRIQYLLKHPPQEKWDGVHTPQLSR
ncbi:MAG: adenylate/guanylate cyclase domain-containing protein [Magnetococcales bacterium]|nr:adenylate/guanylate cyclase domain-containing protein [Magnetococcales bacterium]